MPEANSEWHFNSSVKMLQYLSSNPITVSLYTITLFLNMQCSTIIDIGTCLDEQGFSVSPNKAYVVAGSLGYTEGTEDSEYCTIPEQTDNCEYSYIDTVATINVSVP